MAVKIEPVKPLELDLLAGMSCKTFYDTFHEQNTKEDIELFLNSSFNSEILSAELADPFNHFYFARLENEIVGYLKLSTAKSALLEGDALEISRIYVLKEKLGSGVGKALIEFVFSLAQQLNKASIFLGVWEHNKNAIDFYSRWGFEKFGEHIFYVGNDAQIDWLMKVALGKKKI